MEGKRKADTTVSSRPKRGTGKQPLHQPQFPQLEGAPLFATTKQAAIFGKLNSRRVRSTKFYDTPSMRGLGIHRGITSLFKNIKWERFLELEALTYATATREFLATFARDDVSRRLTFRLHSQPFMLTYDALNAVMCTPMEGYTTF